VPRFARRGIDFLPLPPDLLRSHLLPSTGYHGSSAAAPVALKTMAADNTFRSLRAALAAQLYEAMIAAEPDLPARIAVGDFRPLLAWLRANVHEQGARYETRELIARHRPPARAAAVPASPRDALLGVSGEL
jgi:Carboxypeptidase Taq (M32) metallopeptidase